MAASGNQPVSASNLAAALGASAGSGLTGSEPICVDNLRAVMQKAGDKKLVEYVICDNNSSQTASTSMDPSDFKLLLLYQDYTGIGTRYADPIVVMNPEEGGKYVNGTYVTISGNSVSASLQTNFVIKKITAYK